MFFINLFYLHYCSEKSRWELFLSYVIRYSQSENNCIFLIQVFKTVVKELKLQVSREMNPPLPDGFWSGKEEACWPESSKVEVFLSQ